MAAIGTLSLGLGAATLLFSAVYTVLLRPLPFADQHELVLMWEQDAGSSHVEVSLPNFQDWRAQASSFSDLAAIGSTDWGSLEVRANDPFALTHRVVSSSFFETLGVSAALGRTLGPADDVAGAPAVLVLSHASWRRHFGADPEIVGETITVVGRDEPLVVVGVMPSAFQFPAGTDAWLPVAPALARVFQQGAMDEAQQRALGVLYVIGRLAPGVTRDVARTEMDVVVPPVWDANVALPSSRRIVLTSLEQYVFGTARQALWTLFGAVLLLLAIAVANVAGLQVVRAHARRRDTAVRLALGGSPGRLWRQHLTESAIVTAIAAVCAVAMARAALPLLLALAPTDIPRLESARLDSTVVGFVGALAALCTLVTTLVSAPRVRALAPAGCSGPAPRGRRARGPELAICS